MADSAPKERPRLTDEMQAATQIIQQLHDAGIDPDDPDYSELLASESNIQNRIANLLRVSRRTQAICEALGKIIAEERDRKDRLSRKAERLRDIALYAMQECGLSKVEMPDLTATVTPPKPKVLVIDEQLLPDSMCRIERTANKDALAQALKHGPVPGAEMSNGLPSITVRTR